MMQIQHFFDEITSTLTYVVFKNSDAMIIDPVLDFDPESGKTQKTSVLKVANFVKTNNLNPHFILETHVHADHLSGAGALKEHFPNAKVGIGERVREVQESFKDLLEMESGLKTDGSQFDLLFKGGEEILAGSLSIRILPTPGHTPACLSYLIEDCVFVGDTLFMPDSGTGRCDFPGGSSRDLYHSLKKLYSLPDQTRVFVGHDYQPNGRLLLFESTIAQCKEGNIHLKDETSMDEFVSFRDKRDQSLKPPKLLGPSLRFNIQGPKAFYKTSKFPI